jgi:Na+/citrate or Na+/malate symporter
MTLRASAAMSDERSPEERLKAANRRTGLLLAGIAVLFFFGIILTRLVDDPLVSPAIMGGAAILFLLIAIGRHLRK